MTSHRDLKNLIRERMEKTNESYTSARRSVGTQLTAARSNQPSASAAFVPTSSDALGAQKTSSPLPRNPLLQSTQAEARALLEIAMRAEPRLTTNGVGVYDERAKRERVARTGAGMGLLEAEFAMSRAELYERLDEIAAAADWLRHQTRSVRFNTKHDSYGYKHHVERWFDHRGGPHQYVSNGSFIAAAIGLGWETRPGYPGSPNVQLRVAESGVKAMVSTTSRASEPRRMRDTAKEPKWAESLRSEPTCAVTFVYGRRTPKSRFGAKGVSTACGVMIHGEIVKHRPLTESPAEVTCPACRCIIDANGWHFEASGMCASCDRYPSEGHLPKCVFVLRYGATTEPTARTP